MQLSADGTTKSEQFFNAIFGKETINFSCIHYKTGRPSPQINGLFNENSTNVLEQYNKQDYEIYFVVNGGGYKNRDINKINAVFIDLDCPKVNDQLPQMNAVDDFKQQSMVAIQDFQPTPSIIVESRNGYHVYWLLHEGATIEQFKDCEARLVKHFNADPKVQKPCNLMRVPGFYWCKDVDNKFLVEIIEFNNHRYKVEDIHDALPEEVEPIDMSFRTNNKHQRIKLVVIDGTNNPLHTNENIELIETLNVQALHQLLNPQPITLSKEEVWDFLKKQPLHQFLGVAEKSFRCLIHEDNNPSAGIIINEESGHHIYCCSSSNCGFKGTIIDVTEQLTGLNQFDTLNFLRKVYKVEFAETEWGKNQREALERNQELINGPTIHVLYPEVYKLAKNYLPLIDTLHQIAKHHIYTETFSDSSGRPVFFVSIRELARKLKKDSKNISVHLAALTYLGLVNKLSEGEIPEPFLKRANDEATKHNHKYRVGFYSIPSYDVESLAFSTTKAIEFKEKGFTMKGFSREMLLLALGEAEANRVFPQMAGKAIPQLNEEVTSKMERVALELIRQKGWTTEKEILEQIELHFRGQQKFKETQIKRILPDMYDKYLLIRVPLNNELKEKFGIACKGFPRIIIGVEAA
ncbi:conserved hypothetical protein [Candidatus Desulfosporosinus infrequens]|uniref:RepB-like DNA primase domain-containing protein n=1 Tax=Candidatus Desulfosporosinus infrequens TaxID=2043169 RepID=A0A2U3LBC7_9FIRM|nr:conserved hypothetical protein [Candidatus Desulfosporosinus infrequens]